MQIRVSYYTPHDDISQPDKYREYKEEVRIEYGIKSVK